jgi:hypothetical protein
MLRRFNMRVCGEEFSNGQFFPIRFWSAPHFAEGLTPSGKGYASASKLRMRHAREIVAQWIAPIHRINNTFRKVENTNVLNGAVVAQHSKLERMSVLASRGSICANSVVKYNQL